MIKVHPYTIQVPERTDELQNEKKTGKMIITKDYIATHMHGALLLSFPIGLDYNRYHGGYIGMDKKGRKLILFTDVVMNVPEILVMKENR